jgi:hypothetical protein
MLGRMQMTRAIPDRLLGALGGRTPRLIGYRAAAWLYRLDAIPELMPEFCVPHGSWHRSKFDHQRRRIDDLEVVEIEGVLVTSIRQTLADLCAVVHPDIVERAAESALRMGLVDELALRDFAYLFAFARHGTPGLLKVLDRRFIGEPPTGSDLETCCLQVWRAGGLPRPERQHPVLDAEGELVAIGDFGFLPRLLVVETDGQGTHGVRELQYDNARQNRINDAGYDVRRFTYDDVMHRPRYVCRATLRALHLAPLQVTRPRLLLPR